MNTGDMEKYCPKPHPVYFNAFSMWQQLSGSVQYLIKYIITHAYIHTYTLIYIYYSFDTGEYHESVGLVFTRVPQARA